VNVATLDRGGSERRRAPRDRGALDVVSGEDGSSWTSFLRALVARGLKRVRLAISDSHEGLKHAIGAVLVGASWQRCRVHLSRTVMVRMPRSLQPMVATLIRSIFTQPPTADRLGTAGAGDRAADAPGAGGGRGHPRLCQLPQGALAPDVVEQSPGVSQPGDPPSHRSGRDPSPIGQPSSV
jgi:Transposase, Mutator family